MGRNPISENAGILKKWGILPSIVPVFLGGRRGYTGAANKRRAASGAPRKEGGSLCNKHWRPRAGDGY